jgi:hypothetical protein
MEQVMAELHNVWLEFMVCCICKEYIIPPVTEICTSGHNGCEACVAQLTKCPVCELPADKFRNIGIEEACRNANIRIPCNNLFWGCSERSLIDDMKNHSVVCVYQRILCPFASYVSPCSWGGPIIGLQQHIMENHHDCYVFVTEEEIINLSCPCETQKLVIIRGHEIFLVITHISDSRLLKHYCITLKYVGPKQNIPNYRYEINVAGGYNHEIAPEGDNSNANLEMITDMGGHVHVSNTPCNISVPIHEWSYSIKISRPSEPFVPDDDVNIDNASDYFST